MTSLIPSNTGLSFEVLFDIDGLSRISTEVFFVRENALSKMYQNYFDDCPRCAAVIDVPAEQSHLTPTVYMIAREASFGEYTGAAASDQLDKIWEELHRLISDKVHPAISAGMARRNTRARHLIINGRDLRHEAYQEYSVLIDAGRSEDAGAYALRIIGELNGIAREIIELYS